MATEWTKLVKEKFRLGRMVNPKFSLMQAMKEAKKVYRSTNNVASRITQKARKSRGKKARKSRAKRSRKSRS